MVVIGSLRIRNPMILVPLAGISDLPFRVIARGLGCDLAFTEMISANGLVRSNERSRFYLQSSGEDKPLGVQIFGSDPLIMADAARIVSEQGADLIDVNMGCPVKKVIRNGSGAALLRDPGLVSRILEAVRKATSRPLTVKIRSGWNLQEVNAVHIARIAEQQGVDAVTVHARTAVQGFSGVADWKVIEAVKHSIGIPVIGNGDVKSGSDAWHMIQRTGCDGVMVGRGALGNPWIFKDAVAPPPSPEIRTEPSLAERKAMILHHLDKEAGLLGEEEAVMRFRKHLLWYTKGLRGGAAFRAKATVISHWDLLLREIEAFFSQLEMLCQEEKASQIRS